MPSKRVYNNVGALMPGRSVFDLSYTKTLTCDMGQLLLTVLSAISQFERDLTVERTKEGLIAARARGRKGGRPKSDEKALNKAIKLYQSKEYSIKEIVSMTGISQSTIYRNIK